MSRHKCDKCSYSTPSKFNLVRHQDNDYGCANLKKSAETSEDLIIETPKNDIHLCKLCNTTFTRKDKLTQHERTAAIHQKNLELYNNKMNNVKINSDNNTTNITNHGMILNINYMPAPEVKKPHDYMYMNINDLTLFEQYSLFRHNASVNCSPFKTFLDCFQLNPEKEEYHNVRYPNFKNKNVEVHDGDNWNVGNFDNIQNMIDNLGVLLSSIFNRFRIFLGRRSHVYGIKHLYNGIKCNRGIKKTNEDVRLHIYNKGKKKQTPAHTDKNIPSDRNDPVWKSLSKTFDWNEVVSIINEMDKLNISFDDNLSTILQNLQDKIAKDRTKKVFFSKFINRIEYFICEYTNVHRRNADISSESDELGEFNKYYEEWDKLPVEVRQKKREEKPIKYKLDDHIQMAPNVRHHGARKIGKDFGSSEESD